MNTDRTHALPDSPDGAWCADLRARLDREAHALDGVTAARLAAARHRALAVAKEKSQPRWWTWLGSAVAASLMLAVLWVREPQEPTVTRQTTASMRAVPVTTAPPTTASAPLVQSDVAVIADLEFYDWLEERDALL